MSAELRARQHPVNQAQPPWDAVTVLKGFVIVQFVIPSDQRIPALGAAGSPAILYALAATMWWLWHRVRYSPPWRPAESRIQRAALYIFLGAMIASYIAANVTALPVTELNMADMAMVKLVSMTGLVLVAADGIPDTSRLINFVKFLTGIGSAYATLGLFQFFTGISVINVISIPGLSSDGVSGVDERAGFVRAVATAMHPLEYAMVLSMLLPLSIVVAVYGTNKSFLARWYPLAAIGACSVLSVSRSALIGAAAVLAIMIPSLPRSIRNTMVVLLGFGLAAMYVAVPGMAGTILGMFSGGDTSVSSRTGSYGTAIEFLRVSPVFGRGSGTFLPNYHIFDNQYLLMVIETGVIGLGSFLLLLLASMYGVLLVRRKSDQPVLRLLGLALFAALLSGALLCAFFDSLAFPQACSLLFLMAGVGAAYSWMVRDPAAVPREIGPDAP